LVKSGIFKAIMISLPLYSSERTSRSTVAPFTIRPTVGWFFCTEAPCPDARKPPTTIGPWAMAYT